MSELRETLADLCHQMWSGWMEYMFSPSRSQTTDAGEKIIPPWAVERWTRQMQTPYAALSEAEKNSDRDEADRFLKKMLPWVESAERQASEYKADSLRWQEIAGDYRRERNVYKALVEAIEPERDELRAKLDAALMEIERLMTLIREVKI